MLVRFLALATLAAALLGGGPARAETRKAEWIAASPGKFPQQLPMRPAADTRAATGNRWVVIDMPAGDLAFDTYLLRPGAAAISQAHFASALAEMKAAPWFRARLSPDELDILDRSSIHALPGDRLGARALRVGDDYRVEITSGFGFFVGNVAGIILNHPQGGAGQLEELSLLLASEMDVLAGRPRWYWPPLYAWYRAGIGEPLQPAGDAKLEDFIQRSLLRTLILHELCHHFVGDGDPPALAAMTALMQSDPTAFGEASRAKEIAADRCAAEHVAASGMEPRIVMTFLLLVSTLDSFQGTASHPGGNARIEALRELGEATLDADLADGADPQMVAAIRASFEAMGEAVVDTGPLKAALEALPRGAWPDCPLGPTKGRPVCDAIGP